MNKKDNNLNNEKKCYNCKNYIIVGGYSGECKIANCKLCFPDGICDKYIFGQPEYGCY